MNSHSIFGLKPGFPNFSLGTLILDEDVLNRSRAHDVTRQSINSFRPTALAASKHRTTSPVDGQSDRVTAVIVPSGSSKKSASNIGFFLWGS
jgi:hypothetical protein